MAVVKFEIVGLDVPLGWKGVDIGPKSAELSLQRPLLRPRPCFGTGRWDIRGPSLRIGDDRRSAVRRGRASAKTVVGGGDSVAALDELGLTQKVSFVSTGGGATLEFPIR